jgi:hypothetical protein
MAGATGFVLNVPSSWTDFDLSGEALAAMRQAALAEVHETRLRAEVNDYFRKAREITRAARRQGALYAAGTATMYDDGLFMGHCMVFAVSAPAGQELTLPVLSAQLSRTGDGESAQPADRTVTAVELPDIGTVARVTGTEVAQLMDDIRIRMLTMHTIVPLPGEQGNYLIVTCATPNLPLAEQAYDLFDAITSTFRLVAAPVAGT